MKKIASALSLSATLGTLAVSLAGGASAATSTTYAHTPQSFWTTKAACAPYEANTSKVIKAAKGTIQVETGCLPTNKGWTYYTTYSGVSKPAFTNDKSDDATQAYLSTFHTFYSTTGGETFSTLAKCNADRTAKLNALKSRTDVLITPEDNVQHKPNASFACYYDSGLKANTYNIVYASGSKDKVAFSQYELAIDQF